MALTNNSARVIKPATNPVLNAFGNKHGPAVGFASAIKGIAGDNSAASAKQAEELRSWQEEQARIAREFNRVEAQKNRDWQERMSSTAHQREVNDLVAAGLNPVLSALGGSGAAVTSGSSASTSAPGGAMGSVDTSASGAIVSLLGAFLGLEGTRVSAQANEAVADKYTAMSKYVAELQSQTTLTSTSINAAAQRYTADLHLQGTKYASDRGAAAQEVSAAIHAGAQRYAADRHLESVNLQNLNQQQVTMLNGYINGELQRRGFKQEFDIMDTFPTNAWQHDPDSASVRDWISTISGGVRDIGLGLGGFSQLLPGKGMGKIGF